MLEIIVCKFGGSSVANSELIKQVGDIIKEDDRRNCIIVSAPGKVGKRKYKVTDMLYNLYFQTHNVDDKAVEYTRIEDMSTSEILNEVKGIFSDISSGLGLDGSTYQQCMSELEQSLANPDSTHHDVASRGENFNARLIAEYLNADFVDAADLIYVTDKSPDGDNEVTMQRICALKDRERKVVIGGFYGTSSLQGRIIRTFERGGSDLSGALIAAGVQAVYYENWTDQPGIRCCDPKLFPEDERDAIKIIEKMSFRETRELTYMGFEVFNDKAIGPARKRNIPIYVIHINNSDPNSGTCISSEYDKTQLIRGIAGRNGFCSINVEMYMMDEAVGFGRDLLDIFARRGISYEHSPSGIDNISVILKQNQIQGVEEELKREIKEVLQSYHPVFEDVNQQLIGIPSNEGLKVRKLRFGEPSVVGYWPTVKVDIQKDLALIAIVGEGMRHHIGLASQITTALANAGVNIEILNQGASESNVIVGVRDQDYKPAVRALYQRLIA